MSLPKAKNVKVEEDRDFFSRFPDDILHKIMRLLSPAEVARTSILSESWNSTWKSFPELVRDEETLKDAISREETKALRVSHERVFRSFVNSVNSFVLRRREGGENLALQKFHLFFSGYMFDRWHRHLNLAIAQVLNCSVLDFSLHYQFNYHDEPCDGRPPVRYVLPQSIFDAIGSLEGLELSGCQFPQLRNPPRPRFGSCLRRLELKEVAIGDETLQSLSSNCRNLEELAIVRCIGFRTLNTASLVKLRQFTLSTTKSEIEANTKLFISAPNLPSLCLRSITFCKDFKRHVSFQNLKSLSVRDGVAWEGFIFPLSDLKLFHLETLEFFGFLSREVIHIQSETVRSLSFNDSTTLEKQIKIEAPLLDYFKYEGVYDENIEWLKVSNELKIDLFMSYYGRFSSLACFNKVAQLLRNLSSCKILTLTTQESFPECYRTSHEEGKRVVLFCEIEQLKMKMIGPCTCSIASIVEGLLRISNRPRAIFFQVETENPIFFKVEFGYSTECCNHEAANGFCTGSWRCRLTDVTIAGNYEVALRNDVAKVGMFLKANSPCLKKIRFLLLEGNLGFLA